MEILTNLQNEHRLDFHSHDMFLNSFVRELQDIPDYTSPPLDDALQATPRDYRSDDAIDAAREAAAAGNCTIESSNLCHIPFSPPPGTFEESKIGVIIYNGGLVDPRSYSPLASILSNRYGFPVVLPIFHRDLSFTMGMCDSGRMALAQAEFDVEKWILVGHSLGGISAMADAWTHLTNDSSLNSRVGGLVLLGSSLATLGCGDIDFSTVELPMAYVTGSLDLIVNSTRAELSQKRLSNETFAVDIYGGNHAQFGSYDNSERIKVLGDNQQDGVALIPPQVQWDVSVSAIYHVASRTGATLPQGTASSTLPQGTASQGTASSTQPTAAASCWLWMTLFVMITFNLRF